MPAPRRKNQFADKSMFAVFVMLGAGAIIGLKLGQVSQLIVTGVPVILILLYALMTATRRTRFRLRFDQAGDNCYYLGFIYTLVSLGVALYEVSSGDRQNRIVQDFGIALATTLVGVTLRVILHQMREDPVDVEEAARLELGHAAARIAGQLGGTLNEVVGFRVRTQDELKRFAFETKQVAEEYRAALAAFKDQAEQVSGGLHDLVERLKRIEIPADFLDRRLAPAAAAIESFAERTRALADAEESRVRHVAELTERTRDALRDVHKSVDSMRAFGALPERLARVFEQMAAATEALGEQQRQSERLSARLLEASERIERALKRPDARADGPRWLPGWLGLRRRGPPRIES
jgi:methyl-accepting chemotaxis protein